MTLDQAPAHIETPTCKTGTASPVAPDGRLPGLGVVAGGVLVALLAHEVVGAIGVLTWAVVLGALAANLRLLPASATSGLRYATQRLLRAGIVLLGLSLSVVSVAGMGLPVVALVVTTLLTTLLATVWLGRRVGLGHARSLLIGTGFAICGASAIAAMEPNTESDDDDVAVAIAMVTLCGTAAMVVLPLLQAPLGLSTEQFGVWAGASVHEVGQVVAAASPAGAAAVAVAVVVKLTRVLLLAPVVTVVSVLRRRRLRREGAEAGDGMVPPLVPLFVLAFLICVGVRSTGVLPAGALDVIGHLQTAALAGALFGMGTGVKASRILRGGRTAMAVSLVSTLVVAGVSLAGVYLLA